MKKRIEYFDVAKGIGVLLVLIGHLQGPDYFQYSPYILPMCEWIFSFHMPFFFIISGMLICYKDDVSKDFKDTAGRRFKGIMIPYYWFSFFYMLVIVYAFIKKQILIGIVWLNLWYTLCGYGIKVLWFLPTLFLGELLFIFIMKKLDKKKAAAVIIIQAVIAFIFAHLLTEGVYDTTVKEGMHQLATSLIRPFIACLFIATGYFGFSIINKKAAADSGCNADDAAKSDLTDLKSDNDKGAGKKKINYKEIAASLILIVLGALLVKINLAVDFRSMVFKNVPIYYLCSCFTSFGIILLCKNIYPFKILKFYGVNSLIFMAVHASEKVMMGSILFAMWLNQFLTTARGYICYASILAILLIYVTIMILLINRFAPFIIGKPFKGINLRDRFEHRNKIPKKSR